MISQFLRDIRQLAVGKQSVPSERMLMSVFGLSAMVIIFVVIAFLSSYRPIPVVRPVSQILPVTSLVVVAEPARAPAILPVVAIIPATPSARADDLVVHPVKRDETLIGILRSYCRNDYLAVARENNIDPDWIYANKTVLKFKNGCTHAPSVLVNRNVSPRELASDGGASSGKHIPKLVTRATEAKPLPPVAASAPAPSASQPIRTAALATVATLCDEELVAPKTMLFNERARALQTCFVQKYRLGRHVALKKAKNQLVASLPKPDAVSCEAMAKQGLFAWVTCMREHYGETIRLAASQHRLDESLVLAVLHQESKGDPHAVSTSWCLSFMQILPSTAEAFGVDMQQIFDPHVNIDTGVRVLRRYLDIARGNLNQALASYNLGPGDVQDRMKSSEGFDPAAFAYTRNVLRVKQQIEKESRRLATSAPALVPVVYTPAR